jgi:CRISPR-associated protein Cmr3
MQIFIEPSDVLLFRDGRPFSAGEGHRARSLFPPTPNTMQGVIRSKVLADRCGKYQQYKDGCLGCPEQNNCTIPDEIGKPDKNGRGSYGTLSLKGPLISKSENSHLIAYFPIPADVVQVKDKNNPTADPKLEYLQPLQEQLLGQNDLTYNLLSLWTPETKPVEAIAGYWIHQDLQQYLLGEHPISFTKTSILYEKEARFGIEIDNSKQVVQEGKLYQTEFIRCREHIGLFIEIEGIQRLSDDPEAQLIAIGGENRAASYTEVRKIDWDEFKQKLTSKLQQSVGFKLYLATPTIFKNGWLPNWINCQDLTGEYHGIKITLKAAAVGRYQTIGGWDVAYNKPKQTLRAVAAGSVYYFTSEASSEDIIKAFHWQNLADDPQEAQIGFGMSLVGVWNFCQF